MDEEKLEFVIDLKTNKRGRIAEYAEHFGVEFHAGARPWGIPCDLAFPCATQNELDANDAQQLVDNGVQAVIEGANMPTTLEGVERFQKSKVLYAPSKAANAGGVAVSGLEQTQNMMRLSWTREEVNFKLREIMKQIHGQCVRWGKGKNGVDYVKGANIAGFRKVADAMLGYGVV
jgi:glutamate dehydrogenase (NADP+)